jgi:hypothetical protein
MCCRVIKEELNERMRNEMKRITTPSSLPFDKIVIHFYNMMLSNIRFWTCIDEEMNIGEISSIKILPIKVLIIRKFGNYALNERERNSRQ